MNWGSYLLTRSILSHGYNTYETDDGHREGMEERKHVNGSINLVLAVCSCLRGFVRGFDYVEKMKNFV